jgi:hypothetical protein
MLLAGDKYKVAVFAANAAGETKSDVVTFTVRKKVDPLLQAMINRADAIVNYSWVPSVDITGWEVSASKKTVIFSKGQTVKGMPYTLFTNEIVKDSLKSLAQYKVVAESNYSITKYCNASQGVRTGPIYGSCCATFVCDVFGGEFMNKNGDPIFDYVSGIEASTLVSFNDNAKAKDIRAGDALSIEKNHIIWVGDINGDSVTVYEQTPPKARKQIVFLSKSTDEYGYFKYNGAVYKRLSRPKVLQ